MIAEQSGAPCSHVVSARHTALGFSHAPTNPHDFRRNVLTYIATDDDYIGADQPDMQLPIPADACVTSVIFPAHARRMPVILRPFATSRFLYNMKKEKRKRILAFQQNAIALAPSILLGSSHHTLRYRSLRCLTTASLASLEALERALLSTI
ncbi:hypothetical protein AUP68_14857 [Ilyonectria robusta]